MRTNTSSPLFYECGRPILKFVHLIAYKTLMLRVKNNVLLIGIQSLFTIISNLHNTRQSGKFIQKYVRTTMKSMTVSAVVKP